MKINKSISITIVCFILGITLAWQYQSIRNNAKNADLNQMRKEQLVTDLLHEKEKNENIRKTNQELEESLQKLINSKGNTDKEYKFINEEIEKYRTIAGLTAVKGRGLIITFSKEDNLTLSEVDILYILNELRASDAKAFSINDERVIATSEIRLSGSYLLLNGKQVNPPYIIKAIGDPVNMENALNMLGGLMDQIRFYARDMKLEKSDNITIPKVRDEVIKTDKLTVADKSK